MEEDNIIELSSAPAIEETILKTVNGFSAIGTMADLVGNRKYRRGYNELAGGLYTRDSYIWQALSAASESLGLEVYSNVLHYIDNVSNVDTCKIESLKSMLLLVGVNYMILDKIQFYPIEILKLIDILSMNKRYLLSNKFIKQSFIDVLSAHSDEFADGVIQLSSIVDEYANRNGNAKSSLENFIYDSNVFDEYLRYTFYNFIYDMLDMYIVPDDLLDDFAAYVSAELSSPIEFDIHEACKAYALIKPTDGYGDGSSEYIEDKYRADKRTLNIDISFDVAREVDKVEVGQASIDDYNSDELSLMFKEIDSRKSAMALISSSVIVNMMARNAYYRKKKVIEYALFVDNMSKVNGGISAYETYAYDPSYYLNPHDLTSSYVLLGLDEHLHVTGIDIAKVEDAANNLVSIVNYANKVREVIRLQTRKVFMKGTSNLLEFTVNEFLVDYAKQLRNVLPLSSVSAVIQSLSAHSIKHVQVQEYWDNTEYFNISASTTNAYVSNHGKVNLRYFDEVFSRDGDALIPADPLTFTNEEINEFYLSTFGLKNTLEYATSSLQSHGANGLSSSFYDFLSVLFDIAADPSYYDAKYNVFGTKLSNDIITHDIYSDLSLLNTVSANITSAAAKANFTFTDVSSIYEQKNALVSLLMAVLQDEYLSAVSATYNLYYPLALLISIDFDAEQVKLSTLINLTYVAYFGKSTNSYSYGPDGEYLFDYFVGNPAYSNDEYYILKLNTASSWISEHCYTYALSSAIDRLSGEYDSIKLSIYSNLVDHLLLSGFIDLSLVDLADEMDSIQKFINLKSDARNQYLLQTLENFRQQANQLKTAYDSYAVSFLQVLASMPDTSLGWYMKWVGSNSGDWNCQNEYTVNPEGAKYDLYSLTVYVNKTGSFTSVEFNSSNNIVNSDPLVKNVNRALNRLDECGNIYYGTVGRYSSSAATKPIGTLKDTLRSILANLTKIGTLIDSILDLVQEMFLIDRSDTEFSSLYVGTSPNTNMDYCAKVIALIKYLGSKVTEQMFANDIVLSAYNSYNKSLASISALYIPSRNEYEVLWSKFTTFLQDFEKTSDYKIFKPENIGRLDAYRTEKDSKALAEISENFALLYSGYLSLIDQFMAICNDRISLYTSLTTTYVYEYTGDVLEECLKDFAQHLETDVRIKEDLGNIRVNEDVEFIESLIDIVANGERSSGQVGLYKKYFPTDLVPLSATYSEYEKAFNSLYVSFTTLMDLLFSLLNYTDYDSFNEQMLMFKNYTGITAKEISDLQFIADDPYYNYKNVTHPSYLIHPFLWNFTEKSLVAYALDSVANAYANADIAELEDMRAASSLDKYIGLFGQLINVWKTNVKDFTSYLTRYERSDHICRYTGQYADLVDYDGPFYPPAVDTYLSIGNDASTLLSDTYWQSMSAYYTHLNISIDISLEKRVVDCLSSCRDEISSIVQNAFIDQIHDIYKYLVDSYGNVYILYKDLQDYLQQASSTNDEVTEQTKLNTAGSLWIRLCDTPLAFPLSAIADMQKSAHLDVESDDIPLSELRMHDFEVVSEGDRICFVFEDPKTKLLRCWALYINYDRQALNCGIGNLYFTTSNPDDVKSRHNDADVDNSVAFPDYSRLPSTDDGLFKFLRFAGVFLCKLTNINAVYIDAVGQLLPDGTIELSSAYIPDNPTVYLYIAKPSVPYVPAPIEYPVYLQNIVSKCPVVSYYIDNRNTVQIDMAFAVQPLNGSPVATRISHPNISVDLVDSATGRAYDDPASSEMNSFDIFEQLIRVITLGDYTSNLAYLTNADIGYIPSYPGLSVSGPLDISLSIDNCHLAIELLGKSKDIDEVIDAVNAAPDPYLSETLIYDNFMFGRVWENGVSSLSDTAYSYEHDLSLVVLQNAAFYLNMPSEDSPEAHDGISWYKYNASDSSFVWQVNLNGYSPNDLSRLKVFMYNTNALGKNPYIIKDLSTIMEECAHGGRQNAKYNLSSTYEVNDVGIDINGSTLKVSGTLNGVDESDYSFLNVLDNVRSVKYKYNADDSTFTIWFILENGNVPSFIDAGSIKLVLVNMYDMRFFEWFHLLDEGLTYDDIIYELGRVKGNPFTTEQMLAVDLSKYNALSDVQIDKHHILDTYRKMSFKLDEQDSFPLSSINYYIPSLNIKYPLTFAHVYDENYIQHNVDADMLVHIFKPDEVYAIDVQDPSHLSAIDKILFDACYSTAVDDLRMYEDYLSYDSSLSTYNTSKYTLVDPFLYLYVHFYGTDVPISAVQVSNDISGIVVPDEYSVGTRVVMSANADDEFSEWLSAYELCATKSEEVIDGSFLQLEVDMSNADYESRQKFLLSAKKFLRIYMNYKKSEDGLVLYANYSNYINSPFIKVIDGKSYVDTIEGTYAKIMPNESALLDIIILLRQYSSGLLVGYKNIKVATYLLFNISDDKPKFLLKKLSDIVIENEQISIEYVRVLADQIDNAPYNDYIPYSVSVSKNVELTSSIIAIVTYDSNVLQVDDIPEQMKVIADGTLQILLTNNMPICTFSFLPNSMMIYNGYRTSIKIAEAVSEDLFTIDTINGYILFFSASSE